MLTAKQIKDYNRSVDYFEKVIDEYPSGPFPEQANIKIEILNVIEEAKQVDIGIEKKRKEMTRQLWQH